MSENIRENLSAEEMRTRIIEEITEKFKKEIRETKAKIDEMKKQIEEKEKEIAEVEEEKDKVLGNQSLLLKEIESQKKNLENLKTQETALKTQNEIKKEELKDLEQNIHEKSKKKSELDELQLNIVRKEYDLKNIEEKIQHQQKEFKKETEKLEALKKEYGDINSLKYEFEEVKRQSERRENAKQIRENREKKISENREKEISEKHQKILDEYNEKIDELYECNRDLQQYNNNLKSKLLKQENLNYESALEENKILNSKVTSLEKKISSLETNNQREIRDLEDDKKGLLAKLSKEKDENSRLTIDLVELQGSRMEIEKFNIRYKNSQHVIDELYLDVKKKEEAIDNLKNKQLNREEKIQSIRNPYDQLKKYKEIKKVVELTEMEWLNRIEEKIKTENFRFSKRLIYAFHTSLKTSDWSPITVLAGVSGTGKSELPRLYSVYGGLIYLPLAVQPDWDSPQSLFGYYNSLEGKFNSTKLLKLLYQLQSEGEEEILPLNKYMSLVLLDEMNLAHIELYFSELLSGLERLRSRENVDIDINISEDSPLTIKLERNILWTGTMNQDETTKSLSDKVIDRGSILNFPRPRTLISRREIIKTDEKIEKIELLKKDTWQSWKNKKLDEKLENKLKKYREILEDINSFLEVAGRAIGHRVWQAIENYIMNHPCVISETDEVQRERWIQIAFEDALVHKVMPKLKDLETMGEIKEECLGKIRSIIASSAGGILADFDIAMDNPYGVFGWRSSKYLDEEQGQES